MRLEAAMAIANRINEEIGQHPDTIMERPIVILPPPMLRNLQRELEQREMINNSSGAVRSRVEVFGIPFGSYLPAPAINRPEPFDFVLDANRVTTGIEAMQGGWERRPDYIVADRNVYEQYREAVHGQSQQLIDQANPNNNGVDPRLPGEGPVSRAPSRLPSRRNVPE